MKKIIALSLAVILCVSVLTGCVAKKTFDIESAVLGEPASSSTEKAGDKETQSKEPQDKKNDTLGSVEGISVLSGSFSKPAADKLAYSPCEATGYFAIDGTLMAQTTLTLSTNPNGILNFDLSLKLTSGKSVDAKIEIYKEDKLLASYSENGLELPAGETVINACVATGESSPCSGGYAVKFYINSQLIFEGTGNV